MYPDWPLALACVIAAVIPDADILVGAHRTFTHSLAMALLAGAVASLIAKHLGKPGLRIGVLCGFAYASHILLDWLGKDTAQPRGVMAFWPISRTYFVSGVDLFAEVSRRYWKPDEFLMGNLRSVARELAVLGPPAIAAWWYARRARGLR